MLTPEQFTEFVARASAVSLFSNNFENLHASAAEYRQIALIHASVYGVPEGRPFNLFGSQAETPVQEEEFQSQLKTLLGNTRYAEYRRGKDPEFKLQ